MRIDAKVEERWSIEPCNDHGRPLEGFSPANRRQATHCDKEGKESGELPRSWSRHCQRRSPPLVPFAIYGCGAAIHRKEDGAPVLLLFPPEGSDVVSGQA